MDNQITTSKVDAIVRTPSGIKADKAIETKFKKLKKIEENKNKLSNK